MNWGSCCDACIRLVEPCCVAVAAGLVLICAFVFFTSVISKVALHGSIWAAVHTLIGCWLLANVLFNHAMCVSTSPGSTCEVDPQVLGNAMTWQWRWCRRCNKPKPPLAHHCSVCKKCVLKMDHHCVFMWNCIGHGNYKFFFLYILYVSVGSMYLCVMMFRVLPRLLQPDSDPTRDLPSAFLPFIVFVTAASVCVGLGLMCVWHTLLISKAEGTIEFMDRRLSGPKSKSSSGSSIKAAGHELGLNGRAGRSGMVSGGQESEESGDVGVSKGAGEPQGRRGKVRKAPHNPYDLGFVRNWQLVFDVSGCRLWWLRWFLPSFRKLGLGYEFQTVPLSHQDVCLNESDGEA